MSDFTLSTLSEALVTIISALGDEPNVDDGLTAQQLKNKFDEAPKNIRTFLNNTLIHELEQKIRSMDTAISNAASSSVDTSRIVNLAVTAAKLATDAVETAKIKNAAVTGAKIASGAVSASYSGTINVADWSGSAAPYSAAITVSGILAADKPIIDLVMSGTYATDEAREEAWGNIYRAVTAADTITFYAKEKPTVELPFTALCVRK